jgi:D-glycero-D-manno-heptose 1,7-bisphosphate phosphatase
MPNKTIFLDRDGVINQEKNYLYKIGDFIFIDGIFDACKYFHNLGFRIIIITNQSGIQRGYFTETDYLNLTHWMLDEFKKNNIEILDVFHCPHGPNSLCECRKPMSGMFIKAKEKYNINMNKSWAIGDKEDDIIAAKNAGIHNTVLVRSGHKVNELNSNAEYFLDSINDISRLI